ncbi:hypothetical protein N7489_003577 [Penicillium chrysogenum]|uniref:uncharacterized protein n=1 Tax=Penicillium chrysogenum TaxID=5076 RepID=UPI0024DF179E|nr:uncharacterized protein N7489_003577 [Penicillium chrysogenum]KAJ5253167.1 hypothetical protein N7489_003577 [Penicillium chrysogenum]
MQPYIPYTSDSKIPVTISAIPFFCDELREDAQLRETNICTSLEYRDHLISADPCLGPYGHRFGAKVAAADTAPSPGAYPHRRPVATVQGMPPICPRVTSVAPGSAPVLTLLGSISRPANQGHIRRYRANLGFLPDMQTVLGHASAVQATMSPTIKVEGDGITVSRRSVLLLPPV